MAESVERLAQVEQAIINGDNAKRELQETFGLFFECSPVADADLVRQRIADIRAGIRTLEVQRRALLQERDRLLVCMASRRRRN